MKVLVCGYDFSTSPVGKGFIAELFDDRTKAVQRAELLANLGPKTRTSKRPELMKFIEGRTNHVELSGVDVAILENA